MLTPLECADETVPLVDADAYRLDVLDIDGQVFASTVVDRAEAQRIATHSTGETVAQDAEGVITVVGAATNMGPRTHVLTPRRSGTPQTLTPMERADEMARLVIAAAQQDNACVVTGGLVDTVMKLHADQEPGKANPVSVRRLVRARAAAEGVRVILTDDERYWAIREQLHHMDGDQVHALRDSIADGGDLDPRGHDRVLVEAISVCLSNRLSPARLHGAVPVSISLWHEPEPDGVGSLRECADYPGVAEALDVLRAAEVPVATFPGRKMLWREWHSPQGPQGAFVGPHCGRTLEVSWFIDGAHDERSMRTRNTRTVRGARNRALDDVAGAFDRAGWKVWRVESSNTATRRALRVDVIPPAEEEPSPVVTEEEAEALVAEFGIGEGDLDEAVYEAANEDGADEYNGGAHPELSDDDAYEEVHGAADVRASSVNNQGATAQVQFLAECCGNAEALRSLLEDLTSSAAPSSATTGSDA
ncbi:hypothetical protein [Streptomyces sp. NPDC046976]|uniref:hypothetical protein n=1 Tax=Streptomyces sp. NPDC046976 TaxID=3155258 RepID=UPI0033CF3A43